VLEDVPYGLVFNAALARIVNADTSATDATVTLIATLYGRDFRAENPLIDALGLGAATRESLLARCTG
jgi:opine dehydrogenase